MKLKRKNLRGSKTWTFVRKAIPGWFPRTSLKSYGKEQKNEHSIPGHSDSTDEQAGQGSNEKYFESGEASNLLDAVATNPAGCLFLGPTPDNLLSIPMYMSRILKFTSVSLQAFKTAWADRS